MIETWQGPKYASGLLHTKRLIEWTFSEIKYSRNKSFPSSSITKSNCDKKFFYNQKAILSYTVIN